MILLVAFGFLLIGFGLGSGFVFWLHSTAFEPHEHRSKDAQA